MFVPLKKIFFSKKSKDILKLKQNFISSNDALIQQARSWNKFYNKQPKRKVCKNCENKLGKAAFSSHLANYTICSLCGNFNGLNKDTKKFNQYLYKDNEGKKFSKFYIKDYKSRVKNIYIAKLKFLKKIIKGKKEILEVGSGAGHFLKACEDSGIKAKGFDVNLSMVKLGKKMLKKNEIDHFGINDIYDYVLKCQKEILVILGAIEHLENPNLIFKNFKKSEAKYMFISVPLISLSVFLEHSFQNFYPRVMGGVHNHLYSEQSLKYIIKKNKLNVIGEWWFGTDIMDLMRAVLVYAKPKDEIKYHKGFEKYFMSAIDDLQNVLDKKKICGDVHMIITK